MSIIEQITFLAIWLLPVLFAITFHEVAHGWVALRCGDRTAQMLGRLSLNPINHIDIVGTIIVPVILLITMGIAFGWAKPVPVNWDNLRNPKRDIVLVALAGPAANLLMACFWGMIIKLCPLDYSVYSGFSLMGFIGININLLLMLFNLMPFPPLDGSKVLSALLPPKLARQYKRIEPYGFFILLFLIFTGALKHIINPLMDVFLKLIARIFNIS